VIINDNINLMKKNEEVYSSKEVADKFKVTYLTVFRWIKSGKLKAFKVGKQYRIKQEDLDTFIQSSKSERTKL